MMTIPRPVAHVLPTRSGLLILEAAPSATKPPVDWTFWVKVLRYTLIFTCGFLLGYSL